MRPRAEFRTVLVLPCLVLTFLFGPAGWLLYTSSGRFGGVAKERRSRVARKVTIPSSKLASVFMESPMKRFIGFIGLALAVAGVILAVPRRLSRCPRVPRLLPALLTFRANRSRTF